MPYNEVVGILTDVAVEELGHLEMVSAIIYQLTRNLTPAEIKKAGFDTYFVDHTTGVYPQAAAGMPFNAASIAVKGDVLADIHEDLATWLAILKKTPYAVGVNEPLLIYRVSKNGKSGNKIEAAKMQWRTYRMSKVPFFKAAYCFLVYALRNVKKFRQVKAGMKIYE